MKELTPAMQDLLAGSVVPALATFWLIHREDGVTYGFTDWSDVVIAEGVTYYAKSGLSRTAVMARVDLSVPGFETTGFISSEAITDDDIRAGKFNGATLLNFIAVPTDVDFATYGKIALPGLRVGEITLRDGLWVAEVRGIGYALTQSYVELFMPICRAEFGDARCGVDLVPLTDTGTVTALVTGDRLFTVELDSLNAQGRYMFGLLTWTSGLNDGASMEVRNWSGGDAATGNITLFMSMAAPVAVADTFQLVPGCDKTYSPTTGQGCYVWENTVRFRGEPFVPGQTFLFDYGVATT